MEQAIIKAACAMAPVVCMALGPLVLPWAKATRWEKPGGDGSPAGSCRHLAYQHDHRCAITETTGIYSLLIAFLILFCFVNPCLPGIPKRKE